MNKTGKGLLGFFIGVMFGVFLLGDNGIGIELDKIMFGIAGASMFLFLDSLKESQNKAEGNVW